MKKITLIFLLATISIISFGQKRNDIIKEINAYKKGLVSNATYDKEFSEVWNAIYIIATEEYNTISRESESKGYIEAKQETNTFKEYITIEIRGDKAPYRVSFQVKQEKRTKKEDGSYSNWQAYSSYSLNKYYTSLQTRLYELLNGPIELTEELQKKVDKYNSMQTKNRKKILKGKNY